MKLKTTLKLLSATAAISAGIVSNAQAATFTQDSTVEILDALAVTETQKLNFGIIERPLSAKTVAVTTAGAQDSGNTNATVLDAAAVASGIYTVTGTAGETVSISAVDGANVSGLAFTGITGKFGAGSDTDILGSSITGATLTAGTGTLRVGAILTVQPTVVAGTYAPEFDLSVNYE